MATDLDKKYRELFPEAAAPTPEPTADLDAQYLKLFEPEKYQAPKAEEPKTEGLYWKQYEGPEIVDRQKEPFWRKAAKVVLPKKAEEWFGLDKPMPEKTTEQKIKEWGESMEEYYGRGEDVVGGLLTFGKGLTKLPKQLASSILKATQGSEGASVIDKDWVDRFIQDADQDMNKFVYETSEKYRDKTIISGIPIKVTDFAELPQSLSFSLTSMGGGLAVGVPIGLSAPLAGPGAGAVVASAWVLGTAASGKVAYEMSTYEIMQAYLEAVDEEKRGKTGQGLTPEEEQHHKDLFGAKAMEYGLWEAVPEAVSNLAFAKILTAPLIKMGISKTIAGRMTLKLTGIYGEEFMTETITQMGQTQIAYEAGLPGGREVDWTSFQDWQQAFKEIAPQTFLLTTIMAGAGSAVVKTKDAIHKSRESLKNEIGENHPQYKNLEAKIEEKIVAGRSEIGEKVSDIIEPITPEKIAPEKAVESPIADLIGKKLTVEKGAFEGVPIIAAEPGAKVSFESAEAMQNQLGNKNLTGSFKAIERNSFQQIVDNEIGLKNEYRHRFGKVLNTDNARNLFIDYTGGNSAAVHEPSSYLVKQLYAEDLVAKRGQGNNTVLMTGGGTGAGKTTGIQDIAKLAGESSQAPILYDTNLTSFDSSVQKIEQALAAGFDVKIDYVDREAFDAFSNNGTLARAMLTGRVVPMVEHIDTHINSRETILKLLEKYKDNPKVNISIVNNNLGFKNAAIVEGYDNAVAFIKKGLYNKSETSNLRQKFYDELKRQFESGQISEEVFRRTKGEYAPTGEIQKDGRGVRAELERTDGEVPTQKEIVKEAVKEEPKTIKQIAEETKILEPNIRRILGVGTKEGTFERVDKGIYVLRKEGKDIAYIQTGDAIEILPKMVKEGFKADMVFLDIPYKTPAVVGGNRGIKYDYITPEQFKEVVSAIKEIVRSEDSAVFYMYSQARSGVKEMQRYNDVMTDAGFVPLAKGNYTKYQKDGITRVRNMRGDIIEPEAILMMNLSGNNIAEAPVKLDFDLIRPKGWQTEKPAQMLKDLVELSTKEGETILDPFAGSGVTLAEAVRAGRKAVGIEVSEKAVKEHIIPKVEEAAKEVKIPAKEEFKVGDVIDTQGHSNMVSPVTIREIVGNTLKFTDAKGTDYQGMARATVRTLIKEGAWKKGVEPTKELKITDYYKLKDDFMAGVGLKPGPEKTVAWKDFMEYLPKSGELTQSAALESWMAKTDLTKFKDSEATKILIEELNKIKPLESEVPLDNIQTFYRGSKPGMGIQESFKEGKAVFVSESTKSAEGYARDRTGSVGELTSFDYPYPPVIKKYTAEQITDALPKDHPVFKDPKWDDDAAPAMFDANTDALALYEFGRVFPKELAEAIRNLGVDGVYTRGREGMREFVLIPPTESPIADLIGKKLTVEPGALKGVPVIEVAKEIPKKVKAAKLPTEYLTAQKVISKNKTLPILENFVVQNGKLLATDLEVGVRLNTDLKDGAYKIVGKEAVKADIPIEDFPIIPEVKGDLVGTVLSSALAENMKAANLSKPKTNDYRRAELRGVLLEIKNNQMTIASTDSFRLFRNQQLLKGNDTNVKVLIPSEKATKILADMDSPVEIYDDKKGGIVNFRGKFGDIMIRKIEGDFPAYEEIYPAIDKSYQLDRKEMLKALKEVKPFVSKIQNVDLTYKQTGTYGGEFTILAENKEQNIRKEVKVTANKRKIEPINSGSPNNGVLVMQIKNEDAGPKIDKFSYNVSFLIDAFNSFKEDRVFMYASDKLAEIPQLFSVEDGLKSVAKPKGVANATVGNFREGEQVELGSMDKIKPLEFPELVELSRDLAGRVPEVTKRLKTSLGKFYATERGRIALRADIFSNPVNAAKVLAHEIGHLVDYLPQQTLKRGNLLGSLLSLRSFLKNKFGDVDIKNNQIREELKVVTKYWRPYEASESTASYNSYRNSARELYADAVSMLFNTPGTLQRLAPNFYREFFNALDAKPEVKDAYFDIQEVLSHDRATLIALRRQRTKEMFDRADYKSEELNKIREDERKLRLKDYWHRFTYTVRSINQPIYDKVKEAESKGVYIPDDQNPKYLLSGQNYLSGEIKARFEESVKPVMEDLTKNDIDWQTFGEFLLYERVATGDRSEFANPGGITKPDAIERIATIKQNFGEERFNRLEKNANNFRNFLKELVVEAFNEGMITPEMMKTIESNEKYSPFQVVEYMDNYVSWQTKPQIGTLKDINNPANSLLLKAISTIRAIETQKNRVATFKMLESAFSDEITEAELQFTGKAQRPIESRKEGTGMVTYWKEGKLRGKIVDQYIAKSLSRDSIAKNRAVMTVLSPISYLNQKMFRPLFVIYNPGWIPFNFIRDFMRFWKNTPNLSLITATKRYGQAFRAAKIRAFGMSKKESAQEIKARNLIRQLEKEKVLSVTWNDMLAGQEVEDAQIQAAMEKIGLAESKKEIPSYWKPFATILEKTKILPILRGIKKVGDLVETLPKVAGYMELEGKMPPEKMREFVRKNVGSPDFFEKGYLTPATNNIFLFSNAFIQAVTADAYIATNPTTRSGFWFKTAKVVLTPKILMFAALMGAFGDDVKEWMSDASEYDMTSYYVIPIGRDTASGKTIYLRIPMDETSRLLGGLAWKIMRASSNDQSFGRDVMDIAGLFGGQLPSISPAISAPASVLQFASGENPYDSFRGRKVLTDEQMAAGGWYALKPFLMWQFQQLGGNVFMKLYAGEKTPTEKSAGEKFLQLPIISNIAGRFVRISDYGQLEKYREKLYEIRGEKARERIDEDRLINDYIKKYQNKEGEINEIGQDLIFEVLGHAISSKEEKQRADNIMKKFRIGVKKGEADAKINAMISAISIEEKVTLLRVYQEIMSKEDFEKLRLELLQYNIISTNVLRELNKPFEP